MPAVLRRGPYRLFFYAADREEAKHVHVERGRNVAKFWLGPVRLGDSGGFARMEIGRLRILVERNEDLLSRKWDEFFPE